MRVLWERQREKNTFHGVFPFRCEEKFIAGSRGHGLLWKLSRPCRLRRAGKLLRKSLGAFTTPPAEFLPESRMSRAFSHPG
jgi:hypothetical protein